MRNVPISDLYLERRRALRLDVDLPVRLELADNRSAPGRMRNASVSGALIECALELPTFATLRVEILASGPQLPEPIQITARVIRAEHPCLGVEWRERAPLALTELLQRARGGSAT
jgi:hypothetical protein